MPCVLALFGYACVVMFLGVLLRDPYSKFFYRFTRRAAGYLKPDADPTTADTKASTARPSAQG